MTSLPDGCTCYDETTRRCPLPGHPIQSVHPEYQRGLDAGLKVAEAIRNGAVTTRSSHEWATKLIEEARGK